MLRRISLILALVLVIGALSACAGAGLGTPQLTEEKKVEIERAWVKAEYDVYYYGTYEDYVFLLLSEKTAVHNASETIAGYTFESECFFTLCGALSGTDSFWRVATLYKDGLISEETVATLAKTHAEAPESLPSQSDEKINLWIDCFLEENHWPWNDKEESTSGCFSYGTYKGYEILYCEGEVGITSKQITIAEESFLSDCPFTLYAYREGKLHELKALYEEGIIPSNIIDAIANVHRKRFSLFYEAVTE